MPVNIRNFWTDIDVDGRVTKIGTGPKSGGGGMTITLKQRDRGCVTEVLQILCRAKTDWENGCGKLTTTIRLDADAMEQLVASGVMSVKDSSEVLQFTTYTNSTEEVKSKEISRLKRRLQGPERLALGEARRLITGLQRCFRDLPAEVVDELCNTLMAGQL